MNKFKRVTSTLSRSNWNLEVLVFEDKGKPGYPKKNLELGAWERTNSKLSSHNYLLQTSINFIRNILIQPGEFASGSVKG